MTKLLLADSDRALRDSLPPRLALEGYEVIIADDAQQALSLVRQHKPDVVMLDLGSQASANLAISRSLRAEPAGPVVLLTSGDEQWFDPAGLAGTADGYLAKPFILSELLQHLEAVLQAPAEIEAEPTTFRSGDLWIDVRLRRVVIAGRPIVMSAKEFHLLAELVKHKGTLLKRDELHKRVWGLNHNGDRRTLDVHISWLRRKIEHDPLQPRRIRTVRSLGYRFDG